jgi:exonuclease VII large subunit
MNIRPLLLALLFAIPAFAEDKPAPAPAEKIFAPTDLKELKEMDGKQIVVEGTIAAQGENKSGTIRYLNFARNFRSAISLVFFLGKGGDQFSKEKLGEYVGKKVRVTGTVSTYNDALQIKIDKLDQIQVQP